MLKPELAIELKKASSWKSLMNWGPGGTMLVEFKLYHTLETLRMAIQWLPLWAMKPCSPVMFVEDTLLDKIGVVVMFENCYRALDNTWMEKFPSPATFEDGWAKNCEFSPDKSCLSS